MLGLLALAPLGLVFFYPLWTILRDGLSDGRTWTLRPLAQAVLDPYFLRVLGFTVGQALLSTGLALALGLPGAYLLARYRFPGRRLLLSLSVVPFVLPAITVSLGFVLFFGQSGHLNRLLMAAFGLSRPPFQLLYSLSGIVLAHAFYNAPLVTRLVAASWEALDPRLGEAAASLGAGRLRRFLGVTLPLLLPSVIGSSALVFLFTFLSFPIVLTLGGARYTTLEVEIYTLVRTLLDYRSGAVLIWIELLVSLGVAYVLLRTEARAAAVTQGESLAPRRRLLTRDDWPLKLLLVAPVLVTGLLFLGPILSLVFDSFRVAGRLSLEAYRSLFGQGYSSFLGASAWQSVGNSLLVALLSVALAVPTGFLVGVFGARARFPGKRGIEALLLAPLAVSSVAVGAAILRGLGGPPLRLGGTLFSIALAHALLTYPFVARALRPSLEGLNPTWGEAARSLGASRLRALLSVELPLVRRSVLAAAVFAFGLSVGEMSATAMLARPGTETMPLAVWRLLSARRFAEAGAMGVALMAFSFASVLALDRLEKRGEG